MNLDAARTRLAAAAEARARHIAARVTLPPAAASIPVWDQARLGQGETPFVPKLADPAVLAKARGTRDAQVAQRASIMAEFSTTRPTPNPDEANRMAAGEIVLVKNWDLSPIAVESFDPSEPPGRPVPPPPPINTVPPNVAQLGGTAVGDTLVATVGTWTPAGLTFERAWYRGGRAIPGATGLSYVIQAPDVGYMLTFAVRASTPAGAQNLAGATAVGPIVPASPRARKGSPDDPKTKAPDPRAATAPKR